MRSTINPLRHTCLNTQCPLGWIPICTLSRLHLIILVVLRGIDGRCRYPDKGIVPTQVIFLLKERNQKKINSHRWFFSAFGSLLVPNICVLIVCSPLNRSLLTPYTEPRLSQDVGTRPGPKSLYYLWKAFDRNSNVGGCVYLQSCPKWRLMCRSVIWLARAEKLRRIRVPCGGTSSIPLLLPRILSTR